MTGWSTDISKAPRGRYVVKAHVSPKGTEFDTRTFVSEKVILATKCGKVVLSQYIPDDDRWQMLGKNEQPVAWFAWPEFPHSALSSQDAEQTGEVVPPLTSPVTLSTVSP